MPDLRILTSDPSSSRCQISGSCLRSELLRAARRPAGDQIRAPPRTWRQVSGRTRIQAPRPAQTRIPASKTCQKATHGQTPVNPSKQPKTRTFADFWKKCPETGFPRLFPGFLPKPAPRPGFLLRDRISSKSAWIPGIPDPGVLL